jgi:hypothetical protein
MSLEGPEPYAPSLPYSLNLIPAKPALPSVIPTPNPNNKIKDMYHVSERISRTMANIIKNWELNF